MDLHAALRLIYIVGPAAATDGDRLDQVLGAGVTALWLRAPGVSGADLFRLARELKPRCDAHRKALIVGDRADVALAVGANGVQIGYRSPPARYLRPAYAGWIGVSCHSASDLERAAQARADYAVLSPVFGVPAKGPPLGTTRFRQLLGTVEDLPVVALGGIEGTNAEAVRATGAVGLAVIRALSDTKDPTGTIRLLGG